MEYSDWILIVSFGASILLLTTRVLSISGWSDLILSQEEIGSNFVIGQSWASNFTMITAFLGIILPWVSGTESDQYTSLNFFFTVAFAFASLLYCGFRSVWVFLVADIIVLWCAFGSTMALWWGVYQIDWFPPVTYWLMIVTIPGYLLVISLFSWKTLHQLITQLQSEVLQKRIHPRTPGHILQHWTFR